MLRHTLRQLQQSQAEVRSLTCACLQTLHTTAAAGWVADPAPAPSSSAEPPGGSEQRRRRQGPGAPLAGQQPEDALAVQRAAPLLDRALELYSTAANALNRLLMLVSSLRHHSANEEYVRRYLERSLHMDSFSLEYLHVTRPALFRLSVARDIEPVVSWLRSVGICGEELAELVRHTPAVLSASVDDQLEPLSSLIRAAGGSPKDVLLAYPGLAVVPVAHLKGTRHVLRQLGVADEDISLLLVSLPDLYSQLAEALHRLFQDFGVAAWKLELRHRRQLAGTTYHHMRHWNKPAGAARTAGHHREGGHEEASTGTASSGSGSEDETPRPRRTHLRGVAGRHGHRPSHGHLLSTSLITDSQVYARLKNVCSALETLSLQEESEEDWEAAASQVAHTIQRLSELAEAEASRQGR